ncbi:MAG: hypothetical protein ACRD1H_01795 [Vicinamibacterales bacterium]
MTSRKLITWGGELVLVEVDPLPVPEPLPLDEPLPEPEPPPLDEPLPPDTDTVTVAWSWFPSASSTV